MSIEIKLFSIFDDYQGLGLEAYLLDLLDLFSYEFFGIEMMCVIDLEGSHT